MEQFNPENVRSAPLNYPGKQRILLIGTNIDRQTIENMVEGAASEHNIIEYEILFTTGKRFYEHFFGSADFGKVHENRRLPRVIIASGWARQYDSKGVGMTANIVDFLEDLSSKWGIPLVMPEQAKA